MVAEYSARFLINRGYCCDTNCNNCPYKDLTLQEQYTVLLNKVIEYRYRYYVLANPIISDFEYDILEQKLIGLEINNKTLKVSKYSPSISIGSDNAGNYPDWCKSLNYYS